MPELEITGDEAINTDQVVDDGGSLADHESTYHGPDARRRVDATPAPEPAATTPAVPAALADRSESAAPVEGRDTETGRFKPKHKASGDRAGARDVPRIQELTAKRKEAEAKAAEWEQKYQALEAERRTPAPAVEPIRAVTPGAAFTEKEPDEADFPIEKFAQTTDPYGAQQRAVARAQAAYDRRKESWESQQQQATQRAQESQATLEKRVQEQVTTFAANTPDFYDVLGTIPKGEEPPPLLRSAMHRGDNFAKDVYYLAQHPAVRYELHLLADGKALTDANITSMRQLLDTRMQTDGTGAVAPTPVVRRTPPPPTPVRTGPLKTGDSAPDDGASLAEHEQYYNKPRRR